MKILFDSEIFQFQIFGGISLYFTKLLEEFKKDSAVDFKLPVFYSDNYYIKEKSFSNPLRLYEKEFLFKRQLIKLLNYINKQKTIFSIKAGNFDIFHPTYIFPYFHKYLKSKPYILTVHDMTIETIPEYFVFDKKISDIIKYKKMLIENATRVIAISENTKNDILKYTNYDASKIDVVYHGLPLESTVIAEEIADLPKKFILFIGQRGKYKNFNSFLIAISEILKQDSDLYLVTAGGGGFNKTETDFVKNLGIEHKIIKKPIQNNNQLINYYKKALCFVFPSIYEGFGFPILECFQCNCPLVCADNSSFPEIAGDAAVYFDAYSIESMTENIKKVLYDENLRKNMIQKGQERLKLFSWKKTAQDTKKTYKKVLYE